MKRRTFLRGCGAAVALPWLESLSWAALSPPKRLAFLFVPNGIHMQDWTPKQTGPDYVLPWILEPLAPVKSEFSVLTGLAHDKGRANGDGPGDHARSAAVYLTGSQAFKTAGSDIHVGVSVDQIAAQHLGRGTKLASLELGCEPARQSGQCDSGYSCAYSSNISWRTAHSPLAHEINPREVFERLFGQQHESPRSRERRLAARKSILDYVRDDATRIRARVGRADRRKLDEYFEGVRTIERRIEMAERGESDRPKMDLPAGVPRDYAQHVRLMYDLLAIAFQTDTTRVATYMLANEGSNRSYPMVRVSGGHHQISHHGGDRAKVDAIRRINRWHTGQLVYFLQKLKATPEGEGSLLDHCLIAYGSGISDGNRHNHDDLPVLLAGGGGGTLNPGGHIRYSRETPMSNLFLSLLDRVSVNLASFGDSTGRVSL